MPLKSQGSTKLTQVCLDAKRFSRSNCAGLCIVRHFCKMCVCDYPSGHDQGSNGPSSEPSYEVESSRASSGGLRASAHGLRANGQGLKASWGAVGGYNGAMFVAPRQESNDNLDISCLVDNTPFKLNEVSPA